jgi:hypothetical protein
MTCLVWLIQLQRLIIVVIIDHFYAVAMLFSSSQKEIKVRLMGVGRAYIGYIVFGLIKWK